MMDSKHLIWVETVCLMVGIMHKRDEQKENYARQILIEQQEQGWEGLTMEVADICLQAGLPNVCRKFVKREYIVEALELHHLKEIKLEMEPLSKLTKIRMKDTRKMQKFMKQKSLQDSRTDKDARNIHVTVARSMPRLSQPMTRHTPTQYNGNQKFQQHQ